MTKLTTKVYRALGLNRLADYVEADPAMYFIATTGAFLDGVLFFFLLTYFIN